MTQTIGKKKLALRKRQLRNLLKIKSPLTLKKYTWRAIALEVFDDEIPHGTLQRFATDPDYVPTKKETLALLDLLPAKNPFRPLPKWYTRTTAALEFFNGQRAKITGMYVEMKKQMKQVKESTK